MFFLGLRRSYSSFFMSINKMIHIDLFLNVKPTFHSWEKSNFTIMYYPFYILIDYIC